MNAPLRSLRAAVSVAALVSGFSMSVFAAGDGWMNDWEAAKKLAAEQKKDLLVDFTGSDWCSWCKKLDKEVFSEDAFKAVAKEKYVLVALDFPRSKELPETEKAQNAKLQAEFAVEGFPTIFLADSEGRPFARTGYQPGGADSYVKHLAELTEAKTKRDQALADAGKAEGLDKAKALKAALDGLPDEIGALQPYSSVLDEIKTLDKDDTLGTVKAAATRKAISALEEELMNLMRSGKRQEVPAGVDAFLAKTPLEGEPLQKVLFMKMMSIDQSNLEQANPILDAVVAVDAKSSAGQQAAAIKEQVAAMLAQQKKDKAPEPKKPDAKEKEAGEKSAQ